MRDRFSVRLYIPIPLNNHEYLMPLISCFLKTKQLEAFFTYLVVICDGREVHDAMAPSSPVRS